MRRLGALLVVAVALAGCGSDRPERASGVTERWLQAVSDTGRSRVREDASARATRDGDPVLVLATLPRPVLTRPQYDRLDDEALFDDLEVGRASERAGVARVPFRVTNALDGSAIYRTAVLERRRDTWHIVAVDDSRPGELVPSRGGSRPAGALARHWVAAVAVGAILTVASALVIELQPPPGLTRQSGSASG
jgi:hypothetical protein